MELINVRWRGVSRDILGGVVWLLQRKGRLRTQAKLDT